MSDFVARVRAELDISEAERKLSNFTGKNYKVNINTGDSAKSVDRVNQSLQNTQKSANNLGNTLKKPFQIGSSAAIAAKGIQLVNVAAHNATDAIKDFDDAIKDLRMATNESYASVSNMVSGYTEMGKALGATTKEVSSSADAWLRQGKTVQETNTLIKDSMMLSKIGQIDSAKSTEYLTSAMKGYGIQVQNVQQIVDKLCAVDLVSATDAAGLAEAMSRTAVTADMAGVSMERLLGYLATVGETTQKSMSSIGESFKTIFARMSDIKSDKLELIDEDGTKEVLSDVELTLKNVGIDLRQTVNEYKDYGDVLDSLAAKWDSLSEVQQNALAKAFAGTRQQENFRVLMENYDTARQYMETAANSAGTAEEKFGAYLDSIEAKTKTLQASFESLAVNTFSTKTFGGIVDASSALLDCLDSTNLLKSSLAGLAAAGAVKGFVTMITAAKQAAIQMNNFNASLEMLKKGNLATDEFERLTSLTQTLSQSQLNAVISCKALSDEQRIAILTSAGMSQAEAQAALSSVGLAAAEGTATTATFSLTGAFKGLWATLMANPLALVVAGVTAAVSAYSNYKQKIKLAQQETEAASEAFHESNQKLEDYITKIQELSDKLSSGTLTDAEAYEAKKELLDIQSQLKDSYGEQAAGIDLLNGRGKSYSSLPKASKANVDKYLDAAQQCAKEGKVIGASILGQLAKYYSKGYITLAFYQACIDYNNALESKREAEAQYEIDQETAKAEKASLGSQMVDNVVQEYTNKSKANAAKTTAIQTKQSVKTTRGLSLTKGDYEDLINQSKNDQQIYTDAAAAIDSQIQQNLANGYWTTSSQEYTDAMNTLDDYAKTAGIKS